MKKKNYGMQNKKELQKVNQRLRNLHKKMWPKLDNGKSFLKMKNLKINMLINNKVKMKMQDQ
jgi:hypothetical protein